MSRASRHRVACRPHLETLEDRRLLAICNVTRLGDFGGGAVMGNFARGDLQFCVNYANNNPGPDSINFSVTGTIVLNKPPCCDGKFALESDTTIIGPGADLLAIDGDSGAAWAGPIFRILSGATVSISGLTITNTYGYLVAAAIRNAGTLTLKDSTISNNTNLDTPGYGGAIFNSGKMTISGSTISDNHVGFCCEDKGGGIYNHTSGAMNILNSTISGNHTLAGYGGGIYNAGSLDIRFSTITQNDGEFAAGGIYNQAGAEKLKLYNTIVAGNIGGSGDDNVQGGYTGSANLIGGNPMLGPLQYNGGRTQTHAVLPGSPALDAGDNTNAPDWDQRGPGFPRIVNGTVDIGAFEVQATGAPSGPAVWRGFPETSVVLITADFDDEI
jgi:hypothetical protein